MELLSAQSSASSHGGKCSLQTRRRSSTYRLSCVRELISITRVYTRSTRDHRPMLGDYASSCGSWSLYCAAGNIPMALSEAIIATYMTIHMARSPRFTPIPPVHTVRELRLLARSSGRERKSCGCGFQATKARVRLSDEPILLAKGIVMQASRSPVREHRDSILRHIVREREWTTRISVRT